MDHSSTLVSQRREMIRSRDLYKHNVVKKDNKKIWESREDTRTIRPMKENHAHEVKESYR